MLVVIPEIINKIDIAMYNIGVRVVPPPPPGKNLSVGFWQTILGMPICQTGIIVFEGGHPGRPIGCPARSAWSPSTRSDVESESRGGTTAPVPGRDAQEVPGKEWGEGQRGGLKDVHRCTLLYILMRQDT
jgi:hypothetical protein